MKKSEVMILNKYQKVISKIVKDEVKVRFSKTSFKKVRKEIRAFAKEFHYNLKELIEHKNYCKDINKLIIAHKNHILEANRIITTFERR